jgi:hypothetical protein
VTVGLLAAGLLTAGVGVPARAAEQAAAPTDRAPAGPVAEVADDPTTEEAAEPISPPPIKPPVERPPRTLLRLQVDGGKVVTLRCDPPGGTHPRAAAACEALRAAGGDFDRLQRDPLILCPAVYDPVTARATGVWRSRPVSWTKTFGNGCELYASTRPVFAS